MCKTETNLWLFLNSYISKSRVLVRPIGSIVRVFCVYLLILPEVIASEWNCDWGIAHFYRHPNFKQFLIYLNVEEVFLHNERENMFPNSV